MLFKIYRYWYPDLLIEVKFYFVSQHLPDDSDKFAGTMPKGIVVSPVLCHLLIIVNMETEACWTTVGSTISQYRRGRRFRRLHGKDAFSEVRNIRISIRRSIGWLTSIV